MSVNKGPGGGGAAAAAEQRKEKKKVELRVIIYFFWHVCLLSNVMRKQEILVSFLNLSLGGNLGINFVIIVYLNSMTIGQDRRRHFLKLNFMQSGRAPDHHDDTVDVHA